MTSFRRFLADETGTASIEFVYIVPVIMTLFMGSFESSLYMIRHVMLERSVDIVVRDIRLGRLDGLTHADLKEMICETSALVESVADCVTAMKIWMQPIDTANFVMVPPPRTCVDNVQDIKPIDNPTGSEFEFGTDNEIMLIRICLKEDPMFPTSTLGATMIKDEADGLYAMVSTTVFVNEPG
jgi:hypothetical protein